MDRRQRRHYYQSLRPLLRDIPALSSQWIDEEFASPSEFETTLDDVLRWYKEETNSWLSDGGLLRVHPRILGREFLQRALHLTSMARMMRASTVEFCLLFRIRESHPIRDRDPYDRTGLQRLLTRREAFESLEVRRTDPAGGDLEGGPEEYGHYVGMMGDAGDPDGGADVFEHVYISGRGVQFPDLGEDATTLNIGAESSTDASTEASTDSSTDASSTDASSDASLDASTEVSTELASLDASTELASLDASTELASLDASTELASLDASTELASLDASTELASLDASTELASLDVSYEASSHSTSSHASLDASYEASCEASSHETSDQDSVF